MSTPQPDRTCHVQYLLGFQQPEFLRNAFRVILGREPDPKSHGFFRDRLERGLMTPVEVLGHIRKSREGRARGVRIRGLPSRFLFARVLRRVPLLGPRLVSSLFFRGPHRRVGLTPYVTRDSSGWTRSAAEPSQPFLCPVAVSRLGFPGYREPPPRATGPFATLLNAERPRHVKATAETRRTGTYLATLCTRSYLPFARTLIKSFHRYNPDIPVVLLVVDLDDGDDSPIDDLGDLVTLVSGRELDVPKFDYMALKYSAIDFCCALKPYLLSHVVKTTPAARVIFMDADICVFAPLMEMLDALDSSNIVVTPHTMQPLPYPDRFWEKPTLGDLFNAGVLNAGMFGLTVNSDSVEFIDTWKDLVSVPGAFWISGQMEQHSFNWVTTFAPRVHVLRNKAYNVAYWNLHDRSLRYRGFDEPSAKDEWTVDGQPLVTFHFSGFSPKRPSSLSFHDRRYSLYLLPSVAHLLAFYRKRLEENGADRNWDTDYPFDRFPSGIPIDGTMRDIFKEFETDLFAEISPWTSEGERFYCQALLSPMPQSGSLIPILFKALYDQRPDLQTCFPGAHLEPQTLLPWIASHGISERGYEELFDRHRPCGPALEGARALLRAKERLPRAFAGLPRPLGDDRRKLISRLKNAGADDFAAGLKVLDFEYYHISNLSILRRFVETTAYLRESFPDLLHDDSAAFLEWLESVGAKENLLPDSALTAFARTCNGRALARIFSFVNVQWELAKLWPLAFVGQGSDHLATVLLTELKAGRQFDLEDIEMFRWTMAERPWTGIGLTLELLPNLSGKNSTLYAKGQDDLLAPVLDKSPEFRRELDSYRRMYGPDRRGAQFRDRPPRPDPLRTSFLLEGPRAKEKTVFQLIDRLATTDGPSERTTPRRKGPPSRPTGLHTSRVNPGVNVFGYFKSPIGLGMMTRGLARALELKDVSVSKNLMGNVAMSSDLELTDWLGKFDFSFGSNIFVSYPHDHDLLLNRLPDEMTQGRQNIVYLAWEQRDGSPYWRHVFEGFDQIWALSQFAADSFQRAMDRDVTAVPCAVDFDAFPPPASKESYRLDRKRFTFLYVFDANSSIERKNPEAAMRAFTRAFRPDDTVTLLIKISNAHRLENRQRLRRMFECVAGSNLDIRFVHEDMSRQGVLGLISAADCYVSLHRAEGFSYTCAEAMAYGKPVIATNYSGNLQFMDRRNSYLVDFEEVEVVIPEGPFQRGSVWAEPDVENAAACMREVYLNQEAAHFLGERACRDVRRQLSYEAVAEIAHRALMQGAR